MDTEQKIMCHVASSAKKRALAGFNRKLASGAAYASLCLIAVCDKLRVPLPYETSDSPREFIANAARIGNVLVRNDIEYSFHGGFIVWKRRSSSGKWHPWKSRLAIWHGYDKASDTLFTVELCDGFPSLRAYPNGEWRSGMYRIVGF